MRLISFVPYLMLVISTGAKCKEDTMMMLFFSCIFFFFASNDYISIQASVRSIESYGKCLLDFMGNRNQSKLCEIPHTAETNLAIICSSEEMKTNRQLVYTHKIINHVYAILGCYLLMCKISLLLISCSFYYT